MTQTSAADRLGFLLARHGQVMNTRLRHALGIAGLSPRHAATLIQLAHAGATSQQGLIEILEADASAVVAILNDLEGDGLARRRRDPADRRRHIVEITTAGKRSVSVVERAITEVEEDAFAELSAAELAQLHALLSRIRTKTQDDECAAE
jgi:DNA-binding MarR family transcriptional regulator